MQWSFARPPSLTILVMILGRMIVPFLIASELHPAMCKRIAAVGMVVRFVIAVTVAVVV